MLRAAYEPDDGWVMAVQTAASRVAADDLEDDATAVGSSGAGSCQADHGIEPMPIFPNMSWRSAGR